jgi:glutamyl-Q tRNA(Asp) synthetase
MTTVTRFAPSPTGLLHLGHAYAAGFAYELAHKHGGRFLLRLEDIDATRVRPEYETALMEDLTWLGLSWETPVRKQSEHMADYQRALDVLNDRGLLYPCFCTRKEIMAELANVTAAPQGPDGPLYPGTCRSISQEERSKRMRLGQPYAMRLDMQKALAQVASPLSWQDLTHGLHAVRPEIFGDVILARKEIPTSYHLAVVLDDALQGVTLITRGEDLLPTTHLHRLLQELLNLPVPRWQHHRLILDETGKRLAKRDQSRSLRSLKNERFRAEDVWQCLDISIKKRSE